MRPYCIRKNEIIHLPKKASHPVICEILQNYTKGVVWEVRYDQEENQILIGEAGSVTPAGKDYRVAVHETGVAISGESYAGVMRGFTCLLEKIICVDMEQYLVEEGDVEADSKIDFRAVHLCVFPDTKKAFLRRSVRLAVMAKYTHVVLEFWGTLKYDCFPLLGWDTAFEKQEIKEIMEEARSFGLEIIPFFQHWGHAALSRGGASGKHVVLDRDIRYEYLYRPHTGGWIWNYEKEEVRSLLKSVRDELCDLCGSGGYFHLGCDEAERPRTREDAIRVAEYFNRVADDLKEKGRRAIIWGDMLLSKEFFHPAHRYECNSTPEMVEAMMEVLSRDIIIADWQYNVTDETWDSTEYFKEKGFDVICCPYQSRENVRYAIETAKQNDCGVMLTTWHTLHSSQTALLLQTGWGCYDGQFDDNYYTYSGMVDLTGGIIRKLLPGERYEEYGWKETQINI